MATSHFSLRGMFIGVILCLGIGLLAPFWTVFSYMWIGFNPSSPGAILFFAITVLGSAVIGLVSRRLSLPKADLVLIYCMLLMAVTVPTWGLMFFLLGTMVYPYYYATPENRFEDLLHSHISSWMVPQDERAIKDYYEGLPRGASIPWEAWIEPMGYWLAFVGVLCFMLICASAILHRQWSVHERLTYPMMQLPQQMTEGGRVGSRLAPFFKSWPMWVGFAIPLLLLSMNGLNFFYPEVPQFRQGSSLSLFNNTVHLGFHFKLAYIGFFYLVDLHISFSIWFFYVLCKLEDGLFNTLGISSTEKLSTYEYSQSADLTHQLTGAVFVFVLYGLWNARGHLADVLHKAWNPDAGSDDGEELLSYRTAVAGFLASLLFAGVWLWRSGVPAVLVPVLLITGVIFFILVARVVTTAGVATARSPIVPAYFIISGFGTSILGAKGLVALNFTFIWQGGGIADLSDGRRLQRTQAGGDGARTEGAAVLGADAGPRMQPPRLGLYHFEALLHVRRHKPQSHQLGRGSRVALPRRAHYRDAGCQHERLAVPGHRRRGGGISGIRAAPVALVVAAPAGVCDCRRLAHQLDMVLGDAGMAAQADNPLLLGPAHVPGDEAVLSRPDHGRGRCRRHLGDDLLLHRGDRAYSDQHVT